jgi:hypothetical protein
MTKRFLVGLLLAGLAIASAKSHSLKLSETITVAGTDLKAGDYKLDLTADKVVITNGKQSVESPVKVEQSATKFGATTVRYANAEGKRVLQEIQLGGTNMRLVFNN